MSVTQVPPREPKTLSEALVRGWNCAAVIKGYDLTGGLSLKAGDFRSRATYFGYRAGLRFAPPARLPNDSWQFPTLTQRLSIALNPVRGAWFALQTGWDDGRYLYGEPAMNGEQRGATRAKVTLYRFGFALGGLSRGSLRTVKMLRKIDAFGWEITARHAVCPYCEGRTVTHRRVLRTACKAPCSYDSEWRNDSGYEYASDCSRCGWGDVEPADLTD